MPEQFTQVSMWQVATAMGKYNAPIIYLFGDNNRLPYNDPEVNTAP